MQIGRAGDVARGADIAPSLPAVYGDGTAGAVAYASTSAQAIRPVRVIVTSGPGGQSNTTARLFAQKLTENLGQS